MPLTRRERLHCERFLCEFAAPPGNKDPSACGSHCAQPPGNLTHGWPRKESATWVGERGAAGASRPRTRELGQCSVKAADDTDFRMRNRRADRDGPQAPRLAASSDPDASTDRGPQVAPPGCWCPATRAPRCRRRRRRRHPGRLLNPRCFSVRRPPPPARRLRRPRLCAGKGGAGRGPGPPLLGARARAASRHRADVGSSRAVPPLSSESPIRTSSPSCLPNLESAACSGQRGSAATHWAAAVRSPAEATSENVGRKSFLKAGLFVREGLGKLNKRRAITGSWGGHSTSCAAQN